MEQPVFHVEVQHVRDYEFRVRFDWEHVPELLLDEPEPLGSRKGPNASRLVAAAVGNCLSASLLFCLQKSRIQVRALQARVEGRLGRNENGRWRIVGLTATLILDAGEEDPGRVRRCLDLFEDYCVVTESVRNGIPVSVRVEDTQGRALVEPPPRS